MRSSKRKSFVKKRIRKEKLKLRKENIKQFNIDVISYSNKIREVLIKNATKAEKKLLSILNNSNLANKFEFQYIVFVKKKVNEKVRFYIADFCFPDKKIILELDGEYHYNKSQSYKDRKRTKILNQCGYTVYRLDNRDILNNSNLNLLILELNALLK